MRSRSVAVLPAPAARLIGLALFGTLAAVHWSRMTAEPQTWRVVGGLLIALAAATLVLGTARLSDRRRAVALVAIALLALFVTLLVSGIAWRDLRPGGWDRLTAGVASGLEQLAGVRLPYGGADPWPADVLGAGGGMLLAIAALLAVWPRGASARLGYPLASVAVLTAMVVTPAVSLGNDRPFAVGALLAGAVALFLYAERLPQRPGVGVALLCALALLPALALASAADSDGPWFDYRTFAESLGPEDPVRIDWEQGYGPIGFPRDGRELFRVKSDEPLYWKVQSLEGFERDRFVERGQDGIDRDEDLTPRWFDKPGWVRDIEVTIRRLRGNEVVSAGTVLEYSRSTRELVPGLTPGQLESRKELRRGDSYRLKVYAPRPNPGQLLTASTDPAGQQSDALTVDLPILPTEVFRNRAARRAQARRLRRLPQFERGRPPLTRLHPTAPPLTRLRLTVPGWEAAERGAQPTAAYPDAGIEAAFEPGLRATGYWRTWKLARRLKRGAKSPYEYLQRVDAYLGGDGFSYSERPPAPRRSVAPLDGFLFDTKTGYCQHYAAAMALLLRFGGVPARVAVGFSPGGQSKRAGAYIVRDTDAHAWTEAWFETYGWVTFDATPADTPARSQVAALEDAATAAADTPGADAATRGAGGGGVNRRLGVRGDLVLDSSGRGPVPPDADAANGGGLSWLAIGLAGALLLGSVALVLRVRSRRAARRSGGADPAIAELERALRMTGRGVPVRTTLAELERRYPGEAGAYLRALRAKRYGSNGVAPPAGGRRALRRELAEGLGLPGRVRALRALPPRRR